jgi:DNA-binding CsgD family transcriptional regulator
MRNPVGTRASASKSQSSPLWSSSFRPGPPRIFSPEEILNGIGNSQLGLAVCNRNLQFATVNRKLAEINGIPIKEHDGRFVADVVGPLAATVVTRLIHVFRTAQPLSNAQLVGQLGVNPNRGRWLENYFPIPDEWNPRRVSHVGVFVLPINGLRLRDNSVTSANEYADGSNVRLGLRGDQLHRNLSARDTDVLRLLAEGKCPKEAAEILGISSKTVRNYKDRLMLKLGAHSLADLVRYAIRNQLVSLR